jgi:hypothetical protein
VRDGMPVQVMPPAAPAQPGAKAPAVADGGAGKG